METPKVNFVVLTILDGWGIAPSGPGNAISLSKTPTMDKFLAGFPHTQLIASGEGVGLPKGEIGNTETGHLNIGAGHIVYQDLPRINMAIADGEFFKNKELLGAIAHAKENKSKLHLLGLIGAGGVHANPDHLFALLQMAANNDFHDVFLHIITDGRDSAPTSAMTYIGQLEEEIKKVGVGKIATITGRYWAMDRDFHWDRTEKAYLVMVKGQGKTFTSPEEAIKSSYDLGISDEFIEPAVILNQDNAPVSTIGDNDSVCFFNFRIDRPRQLTKAFVLENFEAEANSLWSFDPYNIKYSKTHLTTQEVRMAPFARGGALRNLYFVTMTKYGDSIPVHVAFAPEVVKLPLGRVISDAGFRQLRAAESEKEKFVTYYFNGLRENAFPGEERLIIPSPKVKTYDLKPEMSAEELTTEVLHYIQENVYKLIVINLANADMVGHTGVIPSAVKACEVVDKCLSEIAQTVQSLSGALVVTADHGNVEEMINPKTGESDTEHSTYPVPFIVVTKDPEPRILPSGVLADIAPTILNLLGIEVPAQMTGRNLLQ